MMSSGCSMGTLLTKWQLLGRPALRPAQDLYNSKPRNITAWMVVVVVVAHEVPPLLAVNGH